jgi:hypothetical protein
MAVGTQGWVNANCLDLAQLDRSHGRQYIALHKKGKGQFRVALRILANAPKLPFAVDLL